jgi:hypothetical protein
MRDDTSAGGLLLLLSALYLLLAFLTGRLDWLVNVKRDVEQAKDAAAAQPQPVFGANLPPATSSGRVS